MTGRTKLSIKRKGKILSSTEENKLKNDLGEKSLVSTQQKNLRKTTLLLVIILLSYWFVLFLYSFFF